MFLLPLSMPSVPSLTLSSSLLSLFPFTFSPSCFPHLISSVTPLTIFPSPLLPCSLLPFSPSCSPYSLLWAFFALSHPLPSLFPTTFLSFLFALLSSSVALRALSHPLFSLFPFTFSPTCSLHLSSSVTPLTISSLPLSFPSWLSLSVPVSMPPLF